jgi:hypothetical protein
MVNWFKIPSDPASPARRQYLIDRYEQTKPRTVRYIILSAVAPVPMPVAFIPALQSLMNPMPTLGLASAIGPDVLQALMNLMPTIGLDSAIGPAPLQFLINPLGLAPIIAPAPAVAADVAPAAAAGVTIAAPSNKKEK